MPARKMETGSVYQQSAYSRAVQTRCPAEFSSNLPQHTGIEAISSIAASQCAYLYNPKSEKVGTVWKTQIKKESSDF